MDIPSKHEFSLPDKKSMLSRASEEGVKAKWEKIKEPSEELTSPDDVPNKERLSGGGLGSEDLAEISSGNMDPEYLHLREEYKDAQEMGEKKSFQDWLNSDDAEVIRKVDLPPEPPKKVIERAKVDEVGYHIGLNRGNLVRKTDKRDRGAVEEFWGNWTQVKDLSKSEIEAIGFGVIGKKISTVIMQLKDNTSITIPAPIFRSVFDGVAPYHDKESGDVTGFEFKNLKGWKGFIHPNTPQDKLDAVMRKMHLNGKSLPDNTRFFITSFEERIPVELPLRKTQEVPVEA
jgi:hypothetical protein